MNGFRHRAIMLDMARLTEKLEYYLFLLPWIKKWGYNTVHLHITDDQGSAIIFPSYPEFAGPHAFSTAEMEKIIKKARELKLEIIPEIEALGHTRFITRNPEYQHLGQKPKTAHYNEFNAIDPENRETRNILKKLFKETTDIFGKGILHVGLDEVNLRVLPTYKKLTEEQAARIIARHAAWVHGEVRKLGCRPAMWGDHVLHSPSIARVFKRDVIMFDWHYRVPVHEKTFKILIQSGFEVWGAPASICWLTRILPNFHNLGNLREFSSLALPYQKKGCTGMVNTVWCPWRYLNGAIEPAIAFAGHLFSSHAESNSFARDFVKNFYGLPFQKAEECGQAIFELYQFTPDNTFFDRVLTGKDHQNSFSREDARKGRECAVKANQLADQLRNVIKSASRNADRLYDLVLAAEQITLIGEFAAQNRKGKIKEALLLQQAIEKAWNRDRWPDLSAPQESHTWVNHCLKYI